MLHCGSMYKFPNTNIAVFVLSVSLLTNAVAWAFHGEIFIHELDHQAQIIQVQTMQEDHQHDEFSDDKNLDLSTHICLSAVYQPIFFTKLPVLDFITGKEILANFVPLHIPESFLDSPLRPPRVLLTTKV